MRARRTAVAALMIMLLGALGVVNLPAASATDLTPNGVGGGDIPGTYSSVDFYLSNGNWAQTLRLAATAGEGARVAIHHDAGYTSELVTTNTDIPKASLTLRQGDDISFVFSTSRRLWLLNTPAKTPNTNGGSGVVPLQPAEKITRFILANGDFVSPVTLPATAADGTMVMVSSKATTTATISPANVLFAGTFNLRTGDTYVFTYKTKYKAWVADGTPVQLLDAGRTGSQLPRPVVPRTTVQFGDGNHVSPVTLPAAAGDRDRITLRSTAGWPATINNTYVNFPGTLKLNAGDEYTFMYVKEKAVWVVMSKPVPAYTPSQLTSGQVPTMRSPLARVKVSDSNWSAIKLPVSARTGDQVIVANEAGWTVDVSGASTVFGTAKIATNETARFIRLSDGRWDRATRTVTMMLTYGQDVVDKAGESVVQKHLRDEVTETNLALENSGANFYVQRVGFLKRQVSDPTLNAALENARVDSVIKTKRTELRADAIYYLSVSDGCGLGHIGASKDYMIAAENWGCGLFTMRHEFGHNMGLAHCYGPNSGYPYAYGVGWDRISDSMCGNSVSGYTSPDTYTADYGITMGIPGTVDGVRAMNQFSAQVAAYN
ncbi:MAG TPA: zinc-dependent metalloprotease family protein [Actinokineospora sp.]|nr:zinc-dependent metalloprotease family protein [Actinokineospora sp.]